MWMKLYISNTAVTKMKLLHAIVMEVIVQRSQLACGSNQKSCFCQRRYPFIDKYK